MPEIQLQFSTLISGSRLQHTLLTARATQRPERDREGEKNDNDNEADDEDEDEVGLQRRCCCNDSADGLTKQLSAVVRISLAPQPFCVCPRGSRGEASK